MKSIICKEPDCDRDVYGNGWCEMHYWRVRRHGDPNIRQRRGNGEGSVRNQKRGDNRIWFTRPDGKRVQQAVLIVERILGEPLPAGARVHHINEDESDDRNQNLVACQDQGLHNIIHGRLNALKACGNARWKPCRHCHKYSDPTLLVKNGTSHYHRECATEYNYRLSSSLSHEAPNPASVGKGVSGDESIPKVSPVD